MKLSGKLMLTAVILILILQLLVSAAVISSEREEKIDAIIGIERTANISNIREEIRAEGGELKKEFEIIDAVTVRIPESAVASLLEESSIRYIEEDKTVYILSVGPPGGQDVPWGIDRVFGDEEYSFSTWEQTRGSGVGVAVLDTGIDEEHESLPAPVDGVNTVDDTHWGVDENGHGTFVSGIIAALDNNLGVVGVAPEADLYAVKILDEEGVGPLSSVIEGLEWSVNSDIPIINMSFGIEDYSESLDEACQTAYDEGHLLIAAAGNDGEEDNVSYPARYNSVIAVAASDENDNIADFSDTGDEIELIAPGKDIVSTYPDENYAVGEGTSYSASHVTGIAALLKAKDASISNNQMRSVIQEKAEDLGLSDNEQGYGLSRADRVTAEAEEEEESVVTVVEIVSGADPALIPKDDENLYEYEARVYDQYGEVMEDEEVVWSLEKLSDFNQLYVELNESELTIQAEAEEDDIKLTAVSETDEDIYDVKEVSLKYDFELREGIIKLLNRKDGFILALPQGIVTVPFEGERLEEINIDEYSVNEFVKINEEIIFDFTELKLEDRREEYEEELTFVLKDEEGKVLAKLVVEIAEEK